MASEPEAANEIVSTQSEKIESEEQLNFNKGQAIQDFIFKISEEFFNKSLTVSEFLKEYIIDKTLDGKEYQVVKRQQLLDAFKKERIDIKLQRQISHKRTLNSSLERLYWCDSHPENSKQSWNKRGYSCIYEISQLW